MEATDHTAFVFHPNTSSFFHPANLPTDVADKLFISGLWWKTQRTKGRSSVVGQRFQIQDLFASLF
jgi:hypothetical protein